MYIINKYNTYIYETRVDMVSKATTIRKSFGCVLGIHICCRDSGRAQETLKDMVVFVHEKVMERKGCWIIVQCGSEAKQHHIPRVGTPFTGSLSRLLRNL